jgi:hypothetical protein
MNWRRSTGNEMELNERDRKREKKKKEDKARKTDATVYGIFWIREGRMRGHPRERGEDRGALRRGSQNFHFLWDALRKPFRAGGA